MANYSVNNTLGGTQQNLSSSYKTIVSIVAGATARRGQIYDVIFGADGTPADNALVFDISRQTAAGTATTVTAVPINPADAAFSGTATANATVEPTVTATSSVLAMALNQRATQRWVAAPGGELVYPATNANGFALRAKSASYTSTAIIEAWFTEL